MDEPPQEPTSRAYLLGPRKWIRALPTTRVTLEGRGTRVEDSLDEN